MFNEVDGQECLSQGCLFEWHKQFCNGREDVDNNKIIVQVILLHLWQMKMIKKSINSSSKIHHQLRIKVIAEIININRERVCNISIENFNEKSVSENGS